VIAVTTTIAKMTGLAGLVGIVVSGVYKLEERHAPRSAVDEVHAEVQSVKASGRVETILDLVDQAHREGAAGWLCRAIEAEFIQLCTDMPQHYLCTDPEAKQELKRKAGCE